MATISTPRAQSPTPQRVQSPPMPQSPAYTPSSSVRASVESLRPDVPDGSPALPDAPQRRNRAALRDYYNLKSKSAPHPAISRTASTASSASNATPSLFAALEGSSISSTFRSQLDEEHFDPGKYVQDFLKSSDLKTILKAEGALVSEIKNLDGERKALVYDNYSRLIAATQTIGTMRKSMDESEKGGLQSIGVLGPAVDGVVECAAALNHGSDKVDSAQRREQRASRKTDRVKRETVKWALETPGRLQKSLDNGRREQAEADWEEVRLLLDNWHQVKGVAELRAACEAIMSKSSAAGG